MKVARSILATLFLSLMVMTGCEETISQEKSVEKKSDGTTVTEEKKTTQQPDGSTKTTEEKKVDK